MSEFRRFATGEKLAVSASQVNAWTDAAIANVGAKPVAGSAGRKGPFRLVKLRTDLGVGKFGECTVMVGPKGAEVESDSILRCFNRFGSLPMGAIAIAAYIVNGWELIAATCGGDEDEPSSSGGE